MALPEARVLAVLRKLVQPAATEAQPEEPKLARLPPLGYWRAESEALRDVLVMLPSVPQALRLERLA